MDSRPVLILGATGMLGRPVVQYLISQGRPVRTLVRNVEAARRLLGDSVEIIEGSALEARDVQGAISGSRAVHTHLTQEAELVAMQHVVHSEAGPGLERVSYVSATTCEETRWFEVVDVKTRTGGPAARGFRLPGRPCPRSSPARCRNPT